MTGVALPPAQRSSPESQGQFVQGFLADTGNGVRQAARLANCQAIVQQQLEDSLPFDAVVKRCGPGNQQHKLATQPVGVGQQPAMRFSKRTDMDGLE